MLDDKIKYYEKTKKMKQTTPASYKKDHPFLKEVDSLALANAQLHLEAAFEKFFKETDISFPKWKSKHQAKQSYTTNMVNGNIRLFTFYFIFIFKQTCRNITILLFAYRHCF